MMRTETVLWPSDVSPRQPGICYGWTTPLILVAGFVPVDVDKVQDVHDAVASSVALPQWRAVLDMFNTLPDVIGFCTGPVSKGAFPDIHLFDAQGVDHRFHFVLYRRHRRQSMRFYAFDFNELDILPSQNSVHDPLPSSSKSAEGFLRADFTRVRACAAKRPAALDGEVLCQANFAQLLADMVDRYMSGRGSDERSTVGSGTTTPNHASSRAETSELPNRCQGLITLWGRIVSRTHMVLRDISTTADQLDVRLEQGVYVAGEVPHVYRDKARTVSSISKYIKFHNCVWLVLNDVIIGVAFGSFLCENQYVLARWLRDFTQHYLVDGMEHALLWLNNWPAGLKLNTELSQFYCQSLIGVVSAWGWLLDRVAPCFPTLIWLVGASGCCGMTMIVSLASDTLGLLTAHLYACYVISATVFSRQLSLAGSLWNLFRGKRYNVLRNRIDSWDYELDQLLLGTILFTLLAFLYPTVLTYYALFASARLAVMMVHAVFDTITALLNHFPLFALLLRVKDPLRLPGGVYVERSRTGHLILSSQPAPLSSIFRHYAHLAGRLTTHYHPLRMLRQLASGRLITPIPRSAIRYNMIPVGGKRGGPP